MSPGRPPLEIRLGTPEEAPRVAAIEAASYRATYRGILPDAALDGFDERERAEVLRGWLTDLPARGHRPWVGIADGSIVGFCWTRPATAHYAEPPPNAGETFELYLDPAWVGQGIGARLFAHGNADLEARGFDPLVVWVFAANAVARRFYERAGFVLDLGPIDVEEEGVLVPAVRYRRDAGTDISA